MGTHPGQDLYVFPPLGETSPPSLSVVVCYSHAVFPKMSKSKGNKTLSDKLAELANPTPQFIDPEDEYNEGNQKNFVIRNYQC